MISAFWIQLVSAPFTLDWYRHLSLWIGQYRHPSLWIDIGALHFGLVSAPFTLDWYRRPSLWIGIGKTLHIGETLHFGSVSLYRRNPSLWIWYRLQPLDTRTTVLQTLRGLHFEGPRRQKYVSRIQFRRSRMPKDFNFEGFWLS
ncbi:unnamed protein product [Rhizophagus irregularis]|nr:unnamed protein product [Rhizophagus irregularis]